jgi:hypothetical protein
LNNKNLFFMKCVSKERKDGFIYNAIFIKYIL